jgi:LacI family transcriptional regulator
VTGRPTLADVAARAGVSLKTASRALNGEYGVAAETARRVLDASRDLGFRPNHLARALAAGRPSATVGLVISNVADHFIASLNGTVEKVLAPRDLQLVTASHRDDPERQRRIIRALVERRVDALVLIPAPGDAAYLAREIDHGLVVVAIDRPLDGMDVDTVTVDNVTGARTAVERLLAAGHRRIAMLGDDGRLWTMKQRFAGYAAALAGAGIPVDERLLLMSFREVPDQEASVRDLLTQPDPPTAVLSAQHMPGRMAIRVAYRLGRDIALATFDDIHDADLLVRPPFVVLSGAQRLATTGARLMLERLDGLTGPSRNLVLPPLFIDSAAQDGYEQMQAYEPVAGPPAADRLVAAAGAR